MFLINLSRSFISSKSQLLFWRLSLNCIKLILETRGSKEASLFLFSINLWKLVMKKLSILFAVLWEPFSSIKYKLWPAVLPFSLAISSLIHCLYKVKNIFQLAWELKSYFQMMEIWRKKLDSTFPVWTKKKSTMMKIFRNLLRTCLSSSSWEGQWQTRKLKKL